MLAAFGVLLVLLLPGLTVVRSYPSAGGIEMDLSGDVAATDYSREVFERVEPGAMVLAHNDVTLFPLWYQRYVVEKESEVLVVARNRWAKVCRRLWGVNLTPVTAEYFAQIARMPSVKRGPRSPMKTAGASIGGRVSR